MRAFFAASCLAALVTASPVALPLANVPALAFDGRTVDTPAPQPPPGRAPAAPQAAEPRTSEGTAPDRMKRLDALFAALKAAPDAEAAKSIATRIDIALTPSGSDTADLLMARASQAMQAKKYDLAVELLDGVLAVEPNHLDAWNRRATVFYLQQDYEDSLRDLQQVVAREPRHYAAWMGIALICKDLGDDANALKAARQALAIYPQLDTAKEMEETLSLTVEGRPI